MFNPLAPFDDKALEGFIKDGHRFFVRQTFNRAKDHFDEGIKGYFLFCHYKDEGPAKEHYDALKHDPYRFLYDWQKETDRKKLLLAASRPEGYKIFTNTFMPDWEHHITNRIKQKVRAYIISQGWKPDNEEGVAISFYPHFGEVMIILKFRRQELRVKFEVIEKMS
jgi:hypothetical protein